MAVAPCSNCGSSDLRVRTITQAQIGMDLLPGLHHFIAPGEFDVVICCACGLMRLFAPADALERLAKSRSWERP